MRMILSGARVFDGERLLDGRAVVVEDGLVVAVAPVDQAPEGDRVTLSGGTLCPAFVDLQVNGGGGLMVDGATTVENLRHICAAHLRLGSAGILPTLITDTPRATQAVIAAGVAAARQGVPGFLGLHLEGPHLDIRRKGAHDPALIRPMTDDDLHLLCAAARDLPALMVTVAPASVTSDQIAALSQAGAVVSLGHTECTAGEAEAAFAVGARCVTHLFNAMSQLGNREPGLVGAALSHPVSVGLIADGVHVLPSVMRIALAAKTEGVFLVSDCMAFAGSDLTEITLGGRRILRRDGRLTLADGTLAGADLTLPRAIAVLVEKVGIAPERALAMATSVPARVIGAADGYGLIAAGRPAHLAHLGPDWSLTAAWHGGRPV